MALVKVTLEDVLKEKYLAHYYRYYTAHCLPAWTNDMLSEYSKQIIYKN